MSPTLAARIGFFLFPRIEGNGDIRWRIALGLPCWCGQRGWPFDCRAQHGDRHHAKHVPGEITYTLTCQQCRAAICPRHLAELDDFAREALAEGALHPDAAAAFTVARLEEHWREDRSCE